ARRLLPAAARRFGSGCLHTARGSARRGDAALSRARTRRLQPAPKEAPQRLAALARPRPGPGRRSREQGSDRSRRTRRDPLGRSVRAHGQGARGVNRRERLAAGLLLLTCACEPKKGAPQAELQRAQFGIFFGPEIQELSEIPLEPEAPGQG